MIAELREGQFQAAWYYTILVIAMLVMLIAGVGWAWGGAARVWRAGDHGPAALIVAASIVGLLVLVGLGLTGLIALLAAGGHG